ncbi:unnamed protein product [Scytosiphon promiscuus]
MAPSSSTAMVAARAEQGMLGALVVPRLTVGKNPFVKSQAGLSAVAVRPHKVHKFHGGDPNRIGDVESLQASQRSSTNSDGRPRSIGDSLPALPSATKRAQKEALREIDEVRTLHHQPSDPSQPRSGFEKLRRKQAERRERDALAVKAFEAGVAAISEDMEQRVLEASYALREGLEDAERAVADVRAEMDVDDRLVQGDMGHVEAIWSELETQCNRRSSHVQEFREGLERIEALRSEAVGGELRRLVDDMVSIACKMPDEIERIAEEHAHELNGVLISNRLAHAELLGTMEKRDFAFAVGVRRAWEIRRGDWRRLRHNRALMYFRSDLRAPNFTNPAERVALFREFKEGQVRRHVKRVELLRDLCGRRPVDTAAQGAATDSKQEGRRQLTTGAVNEIRETYATLHAEEIGAILAAQEGLITIRETKLKESEARREAIRAELHSYGAGCEEPDLEACCLQVEAVIHDHKLEDFLRKAGGLKHELSTLVQSMRSPEIMYDGWLSMAVERNDLLLCGLDLDGVLDKQGKAGMRRSLADSVERLRRAPKNDIPSILNNMRRQAADLAQIPDIDPLLAASLERATEDIDRVVDTIKRRENSSGSGGRGNSGGAASVGSRASRKSGMGSSRGQGSKSAGSVSGSSPGGSRSTGGQSRSATSRGGWESEIEIDMLQVRAVQRRLGMLACTSDLSEEFKANLRGIRSALEQQRACNKAVDGVISEEADGELAARLAEQSQLLERALRSMDARAQGLHACAERTCSFFARVALEIETHGDLEAKIDESGEQRVFDCKEDFRLADEDREDSIRMSTDRVRMAADETELEVSFAKVMDLLDQVEGSYREYHKMAFAAAAVHPTEAAQEAQRTRVAICSLVGLRPPPSPTTEITTQEGKNGSRGERASIAGEGAEGEEGRGREEVRTMKRWRGLTRMDNEGSSSVREGEQQNPQDDERRRYTYRAPRCDASNATGTVEYIVERTPDEVVQGLLSSSNDEDEGDGGGGEEGGGEGDETSSTTDEETEEKEAKGEGDQKEGELARTDRAATSAGGMSAAGADGKKTGSAGGGKGKGKGAAAVDASTAVVPALADLPKYWRGKFTPLDSEGLQALELEKGEEGLEEYFDKRDRRFRELSGEEVEHLQKAAEAEAAVRAQAKEEAEKAAKKGGKKGGGKAKKPAKGAAAPTPPTPEEEAAAAAEPKDPPSVVEVYEAVKLEVDRHRTARKEEAARRRAEERLVPRDPTGEALSMPVGEAAVLFSSLRDDLVARAEIMAETRGAEADSACLEAQDALTEELEERLRKHWPRKGRTEVKSRQPREGELHAHRQKARRFIRQVRDKLSEQEKAFQQELQKGVSARKVFQETIAAMSEGLKDATSIAALQGMESRCKRLVASFEANNETLQPNLQRFAAEEPARLLTSCNDVTRLCKRFAEGGDYDDQELTELENLLQEPREEARFSPREPRERVAQAAEAHRLAVEDEKVFKQEHARCVMELSLREGLGQRYGAPRRNAQERLRSVTMRDERCAQTIERLLDDLDGLLLSRKVGDEDVGCGRDDGDKGPAWGVGSSSDRPEGVGGGSEYAATSSTPAALDDDRTLTQLLRSNLLSIREALFRHAAFLEFLPAPETVHHTRVVPGGDADGPAVSQTPEQEEETEEGGGEELDPEVTLMPHDGETFVGALDALEARCRSETRLLYESEGKEELLGEAGVPESLRAWLEESRERALGEGGHRQGAKRRLRGQVERFEHLVAKRPVPRDVTVGPRAPALMMLDLSSRLDQAASMRRRKQEANFERALFVWEATRAKHQRLLRPAFGSADRRSELDELLAMEADRAAEATAAIASFTRELVREEAAATRQHAAKVSCCFSGVATILDSVVMADDLGTLPGDEDLEPKRKGLRRLRKADRAFLKQQNRDSEAAATASAPAGGKNKPLTDVADETGLPPSTGGRGEGRQWHRRRWKTAGLDDLVRVVLAAETIAVDASGAGDGAAMSFSAVLEILSAEAAKGAGADVERPETATTGVGGSGGNKGGPPPGTSKGGKKGKGTPGDA